MRLVLSLGLVLLALSFGAVAKTPPETGAPSAESCREFYIQLAAHGEQDNPSPAIVAFISELEREKNIQKRLHSMMKDLKLPPGANAHFQIIVEPAQSQLYLQSADLSRDQLVSIHKLLENDPELTALLITQPRTKIRKSVDIAAKVDGQGKLSLERLDFANLNPATRPPLAASEHSGKIVAVEWQEPSAQGFLQGAKEANYYHAEIANSYQAQEYTTYCGVASTCIVLDALNLVDEKLRAAQLPNRHFQDLMISDHQGVKPTLVVRYQQGNDPGFSLEVLAELLRNKNLVAEVRHATLPVNEGADVFREHVKQAFRKRNGASGHIILNFHGQTLGTPTGGHFSPIAAYDPASDRVLVMDVAQHKNEPFWIPIADLYHAMSKVDASSGKARGYIVVGPR